MLGIAHERLILKSMINRDHSMDKRILLVEDEENLMDVIKMNFELEGYHVTGVANGAEAVDVFRSGRYDLIVLDVMLPGMDGYKVCQTIRLENTRVPILFLTAKNASADRIQGLKIGGDDFLSKPFNLEELLLRVSKLMERSLPVSAPMSKKVETIGLCEVNFTTFEITTVSGESKTLSKREINLLKLLLDRTNEVVSRDEILETVWGYDVYPSSRTIDNYILAFRKYFEKDSKHPEHFHSIRGVGYKFTA